MGAALEAGGPIAADDASIARILGKRPVLWVGAGLSIIHERALSHRSSRRSRDDPTHDRKVPQSWRCVTWTRPTGAYAISRQSRLAGTAHRAPVRSP
jgi:hypothetical protein